MNLPPKTILFSNDNLNRHNEFQNIKSLSSYASVKIVVQLTLSPNNNLAIQNLWPEMMKPRKYFLGKKYALAAW